MVPRVADVEIHQFWTEKLTDVLFLSFSIAQIPLMIKMKPERIKNKIFKARECKVFNSKKYIYFA
jgi:hypothetical protein